MTNTEEKQLDTKNNKIEKMLETAEMKILSRVEEKTLGDRFEKNVIQICQIKRYINTQTKKPKLE